MASTAEHYAREVFERYDADAVTLSPYLGLDSIEPYLAYADRGVFLLCRTSNAGGDDLQMLTGRRRALYERVARLAVGWNRGGQLGLVVGATYPPELARVRALVGDMPLLVPGIGAQGATSRAASAGQTSVGAGMVINSSRAILYAGKDGFRRSRALRRARARDEINRHREPRSPPTRLVGRLTVCFSASARGRSGTRAASTLSMRLSMSTISKRQPSHSTMSPVCGRRPSSSMTMPASVL